MVDGPGGEGVCGSEMLASAMLAANAAASRSSSVIAATCARESRCTGWTGWTGWMIAGDGAKSGDGTAGDGGRPAGIAPGCCGLLA